MDDSVAELHGNGHINGIDHQEKKMSATSSTDENLDISAGIGQQHRHELQDQIKPEGKGKIYLNETKIKNRTWPK